MRETFVDSDILTFAIEWCNCENKIALSDLYLLFEGQQFENFISLPQTCVGDICKFGHLPMNCVRAKVTASDLDQLVKGKILTSRKQ